MKQRVTSNHIERLQPNEIFVFGSNLSGHHGGGAALLAMNKWGAIWGQGVGLLMKLTEYRPCRVE